MASRCKKLILAALFSLVLLEAVFRLGPEFRYYSNIVYDPDLGHRGPKDAFVEINFQRLYYNSWGFRDRIVEPEQSEEEMRIVALGDSMTEAVEEPEDNTWTRWTENILNAALTKRVQVYKFAASDWGTYQELLALDRHHEELKPDVVVLQFLGLNDFVNNSIEFAGRSGSENDGWRPYYDPSTGKSSYVSPVRQFFRSVSHAYRAMDAVYVNRYVYGRRGVRRRGKCSPILGLFQENPPERWAHAYEATKEIAKLFGQRKDKYKKIVAVYFPSPIEAVDEVWRSEILNRDKDCAPGVAFDRWKPEKMFEDAFRSAGIETFSLRGAYYLEPDPKVLFYGTGHLTQRGHQRAGEHIAYHFYNNHPQLFGGKK